MPKYWMSSHQQVFKSCFSFRLYILAAKGKYQEIDFGKKPQNQTKNKTPFLSLPILIQTQTTFEVIFTALTFLNSVRYLRTCILLIIYSTVAQKFIGKKGNLNLQISPNTDRRHLFLYFFLIKQPSIHFILQHQSDISTPIKRMNRGRKEGNMTKLIIAALISLRFLMQIDVSFLKLNQL